MAKSISVVVPPNAAAIVPVSKSSALIVPPKGISRCVCTSIPPGITRHPAASTTLPAFSIGSCAPMAETWWPLTPTSATQVSVAVTTVPFLMTMSKRIFLKGLSSYGAKEVRLLAVSRQHVARINIQSFLFVAAHQINIELRHAHRAQSLQLFAMRLDRADQTKTVGDFVGDERRVVAAHFAMMQIIVSAAIAHVRDKCGGQFLRFIFCNQINHVIRNQRGKPTHALARHGQIIRNP